MTSGELQQMHDGDPAFFTILWRTYYPRLRSYVVLVLRESDLVEDVLQETWWRAFSRRRQFTNRGPVEGWLRGICRHTCSDLQRQNRRGAARDRVFEREIGSSAQMSIGECIDRAVETDLLYEAVGAAVAALPPRQRVIVHLRLLEGHSTADTASLLCIAPGTVMAGLFKAKAALRRRLTGVAATWTADARVSRQSTSAK